jgi:hypothetical protein
MSPSPPELLISARANFAATETPKKKKSKSREKAEAGAKLVGAGWLGQKAVRSGLPRLLGVRLESHSTSNKNAKEILKNGGFIDPEKSGSGAIRSLETMQGIDGVTDINKAKNKVYITGLHRDAVSKEITDMMGRKTRLGDNGPIKNVLTRGDMRRGYRAQAEMDWDKIDKAGAKGYAEGYERSMKDFPGNESYAKQAGNVDRAYAAQEERVRQARGSVFNPSKGRSLYIGGSDEFFNTNFKPDFDDPAAMYSDKKVKVYGNRFSATGAAIKREGLLKLMSKNKGRVAAGAAILGVGGYGAYRLGKSAVNTLTGRNEVEVKPFYRRGKLVDGFKRKKRQK